MCLVLCSINSAAVYFGRLLLSQVKGSEAICLLAVELTGARPCLQAGGGGSGTSLRNQLSGCVCVFMCAAPDVASHRTLTLPHFKQPGFFNHLSLVVVAQTWGVGTIMGGRESVQSSGARTGKWLPYI